MFVEGGGGPMPYYNGQIKPDSQQPVELQPQTHFGVFRTYLAAANVGSTCISGEQNLKIEILHTYNIFFSVGNIATARTYPDTSLPIELCIQAVASEVHSFVQYVQTCSWNIGNEHLKSADLRQGESRPGSESVYGIRTPGPDNFRKRTGTFWSKDN